MTTNTIANEIRLRRFQHPQFQRLRFLQETCCQAIAHSKCMRTIVGTAYVGCESILEDRILGHEQCFIVNVRFPPIVALTNSLLPSAKESTMFERYGLHANRDAVDQVNWAMRAEYCSRKFVSGRGCVNLRQRETRFDTLF